MIERVLKLCAGKCDQAEAYSCRTRSTPIVFENGRLSAIETVDRQVLALRVIADGRLGFAVTTELDDLAGLVDRAVATSRHGHAVEIEFASEGAGPEVDTFDEQVAGLAVEDMLRTGQELVEAVRDYDPRVLSTVQVDRSIQEVSVGTTNGQRAQYRATDYSVSVLCELMEGTNQLWVHCTEAKRSRNVDTAKMLEHLFGSLDKGRRNVSFVPGKYPVLFTPSAVFALLTRFLYCLEGRAVMKGFSPWAKSLGKQVLSERVTIVDDPTVPYQVGSVPIDDEGVPTRCKSLIERGVIRNFLLDLTTAASLKMQSTGNGYRNRPLCTAAPSPLPGNIEMMPGESTSAELLGGIKEGLLVDSLMGAWAGNMFAGEVSGNIALGYLVKDGEIVGRVKDAMLAVNAFSALSSQLAAISSDREWRVGGAPDGGLSCLLPFLLVHGVSIAGKA